MTVIEIGLSVVFWMMTLTVGYYIGKEAGRKEANEDK